MSTPEGESNEISYAEAIRAGLQEEMRRDPAIFAYGEDFRLGYVWPVGRGLIDEFGPDRIRDVPLAEQTQVGMAVGAAMGGATAVVEMQYCDFAMLAMDQIINQAAKLCYMSGGQAQTGLVLRMVYGHLQNYGAQHSQTPYAFYTHTPGLKVAAPAFPDDAKGLFKTSIRMGDPILFFEHKKLFATKGPVSDDPEHTIEFGSARTVREGSDVTILAIGLLVHRALAAAETLAAEGISAEVIDPRTLYPFDLDTLVESVKKTGRLLLVDEAPLRGGYTSSIASDVVREAFTALKVPPVRLGVPNVPIPYSWALEGKLIPDEDDIATAVRGLNEDDPTAATKTGKAA